ncbi:MAG: helix-turn-helix domain-containing protein [Agathobaculum sp.]|jgi:hypothetical protein|uniref:helix-turn-helix domain-containing protein n=1 Tax=Agathobaculum sp. TaxID=2048138 RepID=UPI003D9192F7
MKLDLSTISRATDGDSQAIQAILQYYDDYIDALSAYEYEDKDGVIHRKVDPDMKAELQCKLIEAIKKWQELI